MNASHSVTLLALVLLPATGCAAESSSSDARGARIAVSLSERSNMDLLWNVTMMTGASVRNVAR